MCYSTSTQQKSLPLGGDLGEAYHQKIAFAGDFLFFLHKNLRSSKKYCNFAPILYEISKPWVYLMKIK